MFLKGSTGYYLHEPRSPFSSLFLHCFSDLLFNADQPSKSPELRPETANNHENLIKIIIETRPQPRAEKRFRLGGVKPLKLTTITTLSAVFPKAQRSQSEAKKEAEIEASGTQNRQKSTKRPPSQTVKNKTTKSWSEF